MRYSPAVGLVLAVVQAKASLLFERADTCANVVNSPFKVLLSGNTVTIGLINTCICHSGVPNFLSTNIVAIAAVSVAGSPAATAAVLSLIATSNPRTCTYPAHAAGSCKAGNPCSFSCWDGFTPSPATNPTTCACEAPNTVCDGICTSQACPSGHLMVGKRGLSAVHLRCPYGQAACAVPGRGSKSSWECVDTQNDLESCELVADGVDCTAIRRVSDVSCIRERAKKVDYLRTQDGHRSLLN
ncbi:unnamed protein product [Cyclocybe aegerita]|uniref:Protein CPL1-like domain-containing protein n=1 Tax=Cyclocybe aegerita TaxID=1973307 RepID=A0A8S0VSW1_CYCAE|nr:unnamed protein product [Cyclocybe aegerita]